MRKTILIATLSAGVALPAAAEVTRVEVAKRADVGASGYEKIIGTIRVAIDPNDPHNRAIVDIDKATTKRAGIRMPEHSVPVASCTGWNFRNQSARGTAYLVSLMGSSIPFARTPTERQTGDSRTPISERYPSNDQYLAKAREHGDRLVKTRYLLADDVSAVMKRMEEHWLEATATRN